MAFFYPDENMISKLFSKVSSKLGEVCYNIINKKNLNLYLPQMAVEKKFIKYICICVLYNR